MVSNEAEAPGEKTVSSGNFSGSSVRVGRLPSDAAAPNETQPQPFDDVSRATAIRASGALRSNS